MTTSFFKKITSFVDPKRYFITTTSQKTLFYPGWIWSSAFVIDSQSKKDQIYALMKNFMVFFWIIFIPFPLILICLIKLMLNDLNDIVQDNHFITHILCILFILYAFSPSFYLSWKIRKITRGLQKLSRLETLKILTEHHKLSFLILFFFFISLFITFPLSWLMLIVNQSFLEIIIGSIPVIIERIQLISLTSLTFYILVIMGLYNRKSSFIKQHYR